MADRSALRVAVVPLTMPNLVLGVTALCALAVVALATRLGLVLVGDIVPNLLLSLAHLVTSFVGGKGNPTPTDD
jgi:hypothetical protein